MTAIYTNKHNNNHNRTQCQSSWWVSLSLGSALFALGFNASRLFFSDPYPRGLLLSGEEFQNSISADNNTNNNENHDSNNEPPPVFAASQLTTEWDSAQLQHQLIVSDQDRHSLRAATHQVRVQIPGVPGVEYQVPFYTTKVPWLSQRTFLSNIFFCPPNGHEGTITHLIGQLLSQNGDGSFVDVGSNLGFYSLLAVSMERNAYAFDIQPVCLYNLQSLASTMKDPSLLHVYNVGMSDTEQTVINAEGGCDYENFYVTSDQQDNRGQVLDTTKAGIGVTVPVVRMDHWVQTMGSQLKGPIQVLKMDTEGAEGRIAMGMQETLATCLIRNWIVELTPAHWFRFGQAMDDPDAIQAFVNVTEQYNYKAYFMYMQKERQPPPSLYHIVRPLSQHPTMPSESGTGCFDAPYYEILDLRKFIVEYCLEFADTVIRGQTGGQKHTAKGFCGNIWFQKQGC